MTQAAAQKPLLLVDIDGVLNPFTADSVPDGFDEHRLAGMRVLLSPTHGEWLRELGKEFELVWATTWEADANLLIGPLIGLPELPFITFTPPDPTFEGYTLKLPDVIAFVRDRPAAWIDDDLSSDARYWSHWRRTELGIPTLLVDVYPRSGLRESHVERLRSFAADIRAGRRDAGAEWLDPHDGPSEEPSEAEGKTPRE